jgi:hypothetical protein
MKTIFISLLLLLSLQSFAQMRVEDIKTDKDMTKFLDEYYFKGKDTLVRYDMIAYYKKTWDTLFSRDYDTVVTKYLDSLKSPRWIKTDFNKDGKMDIVVNADFYTDSFRDETKVLAFISQKSNQYSCTELSVFANEFSPYFIKYDKAKKWLMVGVADFDNENWDTSYHFNDKFRVDTLVYQNNSFIEYYVDMPAVNSIDTFKCTFKGSLARGSDMVIIPKEGNIRFLKYSFNDSLKKRTVDFYEMNWNSKIKDSFLLFAEKLPYLKYGEYYDPSSHGWHDGFHWTTEIEFSNGSRNKILDRLETAPAGLRYLYGYIKELRKSDKWVFVKTIVE